MIERSVGLPAACEDCQKGYRVPSSARTYPCKACGGTVRALVEDGEGADPLSDEEHAQLGQDVAGALQRAYTWLGAVTWLYRLGALAYGIVAVLAILALARPEVPVEGGVWIVVLTTSLAVILLTGALHVLFEPFIWTLVIASLATLLSVAHFFGPNPLGLAFPASAGLAVLLWAALLPTLRFRKWIAEHKDLYILHYVSLQTRRTLKGRTGEERHARLVRAMRRADRRAWKLTAVSAAFFCLLNACGVLFVLSSARPPEFTPARERFESAWNEGGLTEAVACIDARVRDPQAAWLEGAIEGHGLQEALPRLESGATREGPEGRWIDYRLGELPLSALWTTLDNEWVLARIELPVPPLEPVLERFRQAWKTSEPAAVVAFFSPDARGEMLASIEDAMLGRDWIGLPEIQSTKVDDDEGERERSVAFLLPRDKLATNWRLRADGRWGLSFLKFPKR